MKLLLKICFLGTNYNGYQVQPDRPTVQGAMNDASARIFGFDCDIVGCSRTDSGVHANEFFVCVTKRGEGCLDCTIPMSSIPAAFNSVLPDDIAVLEGKMVSDSFHPRYDVKYKEYIYKIYDSPIKDPFYAGRAYHLGRSISDEMIDIMDASAREFCGSHDFSAFMAQGSKITDTVRDVKYASVRREGDLVVFTVAADGFLYNMVRIMCGTLLRAARRSASPEEIGTIIESRCRSNAGETAPACGLYLNRVVY